MSDLRARLAERAAELLESSRVPGLALGLFHGAEEIAAGFGITNTDHPLPVDERTLFQIASLSKPFTATLLMQLVERDVVELERPVSEYLPELRLPEPAWTDRVRVEDLLTHRGGWDGDRFFVRPPAEATLAGLVAEFADNRSLSPPGTEFSYNNAGFSLAGRLIERLTGSAYPDALRERLLEPLGMQCSFLRADEVLSHRVAAPHVVGPETAPVLRGAGWQPDWEMLPHDQPAAGIVSCVHDLGLWCRFQLGDGRSRDGTRLLEESTLRRMQQWHYAGGSNFDGVGLGWLIRDFDGLRSFGHSGHCSGYLADMYLERERGFGLLLLTNSVNDGGLRRDLRNFALSSLFGLEPRDPEPLAAPPSDLDAYLGDYAAAFGRIEVTPGKRPGELRVEHHPWEPKPGHWYPPPRGAASCAFYAPDRLVGLPGGELRGERLDFGRDPAGGVAWIRSGARIAPRGGDVGLEV